MSKKIISLLLILVIILGLVPTTVFASGTGATNISFEMGSNFVAGQEKEVELVVTPISADVNKQVAAVFEFSNKEDIESISVFNPSTSGWDNINSSTTNFNFIFYIDGLDSFGKLTKTFKIKFKSDANISAANLLDVSLKTVTAGVINKTDVLDSLNIVFAVAKAPETELSNDLEDDNVTAGSWHEFNLSISPIAADTGKSVKNVIEFSNPTNIDSFEHWNTTSNSWETVTLDSTGKNIGDAFTLGAPGSNKTDKYRVKFKETATVGGYSFNSKLMLMSGSTMTSTVICQTTANFNVTAYMPPLPTTLTSDINGKVITAGTWHEFNVTLHAKSNDANKKVAYVSNFNNYEDVEKVEYWNTDSNSWENITIDSSGEFIFNSNFSMPSTDVDIDSKFRVKFKEDAVIGNYNFTVQLKLMSGSSVGDTILSSSLSIFNIIAPSATPPTTASSELTTTINGATITAGDWYEFNIKFDGSVDDAGNSVVNHSEFTSSNQISNLEYWDEATSSWKNLSISSEGYFSTDIVYDITSSGLSNTTKYRVKFKEDATTGGYSLISKMLLVTATGVSATSICDVVAAFNVVSPSVTPPVTPPTGSSNLSTDLSGSIPFDTWKEFTLTLNCNASDAGKKAIVVSTFSNPEILDKLEYWDESASAWQNVVFDGNGKFSVGSGFNMPSSNSVKTDKYRVKFKHVTNISTSYSLSAKVNVVSGTTVTDDVICQTSASFTINHTPVATGGWKYNSTSHWHEASCGCRLDSASHTSSDWIIDVAATDTTSGEKHKECTVCHRILDVETIPATKPILPVTIDININSDGGKIIYKSILNKDSVDISLSTAELNKLVSKNIDVGVVTVDISATKEDINKVIISNATLKSLMKATSTTDIEGLKIKFTNNTSVVLNNEGIKYLVDKTSRDITIYLDEIANTNLNSKQKEAVKNMNVLGYYKAYISAGNSYIGEFEDGTATININDKILGNNDFRAMEGFVFDNSGKISNVRVFYHDEIELAMTNKDVYILAINKNITAKTCPKDNTCPLHKYVDIDVNGWYHEAIHYVLDNNLMVGYSTTKFGPNDTLTRGQLLTILWRIQGSPKVNYNLTFKDVSSSSYYYEAVKWAKANNIINGYSETSFGPNDGINREQLVVIMQNFAKLKNIDTSVKNSNSLDSYKDVKNISSWATKSVEWAVSEGLIIGYGDNLSPKNLTTRAQVATILQRFCENYLK